MNDVYDLRNSVLAKLKLKCDFCVYSGHVGPPLPCNLMKLVDVPEMNYLAANGEGEVRSDTLLAITMGLCSFCLQGPVSFNLVNLIEFCIVFPFRIFI